MSVSGAQTFSTSDVPPAVRLDRWVGFGCETLVHMSVDPADRASFRASITRVPVGPLGIAWMHTTPATARILARGPGAWAAPSRDVHLLVVQGRGSSRISLRGRSPTVLHYGDMILRDAFVPWTTETLEPTFLVMVKLPTGELRRRVGDGRPPRAPRARLRPRVPIDGPALAHLPLEPARPAAVDLHEEGQLIAAERVVADAGVRRPRQRPEVPGRLVVVEDDQLVELSGVRHQPKIRCTSCTASTRASTSARVL